MKYIKYILTFLFMFTALAANARTLNFALVSDIHYDINKGSKLTTSQKALDGLIARINENDYDFVVFLGDNIDKSRKEVLESFLDRIKDIKTPYYIVLGNTDAHKISGLTKQEFMEIVKKKNKNQRSLSPSYTFSPASGFLCIVLDSTSSFMPSTHGIFTDKTYEWYDRTLKENKDKKVLVFQHVPYNEPYEDATHNILDKYQYKYILDKHNNIYLIASGHYHKSAFATDENGLNHVSTPALKTPPFQFIDVKLKYSKLPFGKPKKLELYGELKEAL